MIFSYLKDGHEGSARRGYDTILVRSVHRVIVMVEVVCKGITSRVTCGVAAILDEIGLLLPSNSQSLPNYAYTLGLATIYEEFLDDAS